MTKKPYPKFENDDEEQAFLDAAKSRGIRPDRGRRADAEMARRL